MWGKGEGTLLKKGCLLPSPTPPPLILPRLLTGGEAARRESPLRGYMVNKTGRPGQSGRPVLFWERLMPAINQLIKTAWPCLPTEKGAPVCCFSLRCAISKACHIRNAMGLKTHLFYTVGIGTANPRSSRQLDTIDGNQLTIFSSHEKSCFQWLQIVTYK